MRARDVVRRVKDAIVVDGPWLTSCDGPPRLPDRCGGDGCRHCGRTEDVTCAPCPYAEDVHGDSTPVLMCGSCRHEAAQDI